MPHEARRDRTVRLRARLHKINHRLAILASIGWVHFEDGARDELEQRRDEISAELSRLLAAGPSPTTTTSKPVAEEERKVSAEDRRLRVKDIIVALTESQLWGVMPDEIARHARIHLKTLYRYLKHETVKNTWDSYLRESAGKVPASLEDLGDDRSFSFSDRD
jgi:hypothetical protein